MGEINKCNDNSNSKQAKTTKKSVAIVLGSIIACLLIVIIVLVANVFKKPANDVSSVDVTNSLIQANMANWGYAIYDGTDTYYSDGNSGIYKLNENQERALFIEGSYRDMGLVNGKIYCVEIIESNNDSGSEQIIVGINIANGKKSVVYQPIASDSMLMSVNVLNDKYYFVVDYDSLYSIDGKGKVENTEIHSVKKVTESGVYTSVDSKYGLKLVSFQGETIKTYSELSAYEVNVSFELGNDIYLNYTEDNTGKICRMNKSTGKLTPFPEDKSFFDGSAMSYINYYDGVFYISTSRASDGNFENSVFLMDSNGKNIKEIYNQESQLPFCTINIIDKYLMIHLPLNKEDVKIIDLNDISSK